MSAYLVVLKFDNKDEARETTELYDTELIGAYKIPTEHTDHCACEDRTVLGSGTDPRSYRGKKFGWWVRKCCGKPAYTSNHMPINLKPEADPNKLLSIHWWNRPWVNPKKK